MYRSSSFKNYADLKNQAAANKMENYGRIANDATLLDHFMREVEIIKEDVKSMENIHKRLNEKNEESKTIQDSAKMKELRAQMDSELDHVLILANSIKKRIEAIENPSNNNNSTIEIVISGVGSSIDRTKISVLMGLGKKLSEMMDAFQGLRAQIASVYRETVEQKYSEFTGEKKHIETIETTLAPNNGEIEESLRDTIQEHGTDRVLVFVQEFQERREGSKKMQRSLVEVHQIFLDIAALVEGYGRKMANNCEKDHMARDNSFSKPTGVAELLDKPEDYDMDAKRRAKIALILAVCFFVMIIVPIFISESQRDWE